MTHTLNIKRLPHAQALPLPQYATSHSAGMDLVAALAADQSIILEVGQRVLIPTGLILEIPSGFEGQVRPRSGLALKYGVSVLNSPGTIDSDYRGEVQVILINLGQEPFKIERGMRIAQLVIAPLINVNVCEVEHLSTTIRGSGGFGSTGVIAK